MADLAHALGALQNGCGRGASSRVDMEVHVTDKPFWWNNSLTDRDMSRVVASLPPNVQVWGWILVELFVIFGFISSNISLLLA